MGYLFELLKIKYDNFRNPIGYTIAVINILGGFALFGGGMNFLGTCFLLAGVIILFDTHEYK
tara:strand:- start:1604 stop:1789 length:186 start_codon:yes stop_codon:yes gene_type:complete